MSNTVYVGALYTYDVDGSKYDLTPLKNDANDAGYDKVITNYSGEGIYTESNDNPRLNGKRIDDNAIIFVAKNMAYSNGETGADAKVISGKELKTWNGNYGLVGQTLSNTKNGVDTVMVGSIVIRNDTYGSESGNYGIITSTPETIKVNGSSYQSFNLWNGTEDVKTIAKISVMNGAKKGSVVEFDTDGSEGDLPKIKNLEVKSITGAMLGAEANGSKYDVTISISGNADDQITYTADSDTTILFISNKAGVKGGSITDYAAMESSIDDVYVQNVIFVADGSGDLDLIVIDVRGKLAVNSDLAKSSTLSSGINVDLEKKTIVFPVNTNITNDAVKGCFDHVLAVEALNQENTRYTVIATDGSEYTFDVSNATAP